MTDDNPIPLSFEEAERRLRGQIAACQDRAARRGLTVDLVALYSRNDRHPQAIQLVRDLMADARHPPEEAQCLLQLGQLHEQTGDFPAARDFYERGLALDAGEPWVRYLLHNNLGYSLNQLGEHKAAQTYCLQAIELGPARHNAWKNLGISLEGQGRPKPAAEMYLKAAELRPQDPRAMRHLLELAARRPEITDEVEDFAERVTRCRRQAAATNEST